MVWADISTVNATNDLSQFFIYANNVSEGVFMPMLLFAFFVVTMLSSYFFQMKWKATARFDTCFGVAGILTLGMAAILSTINGLISPGYLLITALVAVVGVLWMWFSGSEQ